MEIRVGSQSLKMNTGKTKIMFSGSMKVRVEEKLSGLAVCTRRELAVIRFCASIARDGSINDAVE